MTLCRCGFSRTLRSWACLSCGARARNRQTDGSWSSACGRMRRGKAGELAGDGLKDASDGPQICQITFVGLPRDFIKPADGLRLQTGFAPVLDRENNFHFDLNGVLP